MKSGAKGFTLIELVVVITIIGILAAVAAPRFINLQTDARVATLEGVEASMRSAASLVYAKSLIAGVEQAAATTVVVNGANVNVVFGYPADTDIIGLLDIQGGDLLSDADAVVGYGLTDPAAVEADCRVTYAQPGAAGAQPTVTPLVGGC